jgi:predicted transcriptional regulator
MRVYKIGKIEHLVYEDKSELPDYLTIVDNWREAAIGDWVKADDGCYIQILRGGSMKEVSGKKHSYIGTCTGTFHVKDSVKLDTSRRENIYSFGGVPAGENRDKLTKSEALFVAYASSGMDHEEAYLKAFKTKNKRYACKKASSLLRTDRVITAMKEELKPVMEELELDPTFVLKKIKDVITSTDKDETKLKALFKLADIMDMEDKNKTTVTQVSGALFQGFTPEVLEGAERPKEIDTTSTTKE